MDKSFSIVNDSEDPNYENWLALFACIVNHKLTIGHALKVMGLTTDKGKNKILGGEVDES